MTPNLATPALAWTLGSPGGAALEPLGLRWQTGALWRGAQVAQAGSPQIAQLFQQHGPAVFRRALRLLGNRADAEEATQEIFIRALRGEEAFQQRSQLTTWLYQITTNYCLNLLRDRGRRSELSAQHLEAPGGEVAPARSDDVALVRRLLATADPQQAQAVVYVFLDGMSHEEAAGVLGVSKRTVGNLIDRFRAWAQETPEAPGDTPARASGGRS